MIRGVGRPQAKGQRSNGVVSEHAVLSSEDLMVITGSGEAAMAALINIDSLITVGL